MVNEDVTSRGVKDGDPIATILFVFMIFLMFEWFANGGTCAVGAFSNGSWLANPNTCINPVGIGGTGQNPTLNVQYQFNWVFTNTKWIMVLLIPLGVMMMVWYMGERMVDEEGQSSVRDFLGPLVNALNPDGGGKITDEQSPSRIARTEASQRRSSRSRPEEAPRPRQLSPQEKLQLIRSLTEVRRLENDEDYRQEELDQ